MDEHIAEDDLLDLVCGARPLGASPEIEAHLAECGVCSGVVAALAARRSEAPRPPLTGRSFGPYRVEERIGEGAMGEVYRANDARLGRDVALKVLAPRALGSPENVRRLVAEARAAASITHPNVVTIHDVGEADDSPFLVSELIEGESLRSRVDRGPIPYGLALHLGAQLARGLAAAHAKGVIHRDLKPHNLIVAGESTLKILDFGLAKLEGEGARDLDATEPGAVLGTAGYLSPEQARGEPADARSDLFAAGAILYEMLSGQRAFGGATFAERVSAVLRDTPPRLSDGSLGDAGPVVARCLQKDPRGRFQSAEDLAWVLEGLADKPSGRAPERTTPLPARGDRPSGARMGRRTLLVAGAALGLGGLGVGRLLGSGAQSAQGESKPSSSPASEAPTLAPPRAAYEQITYRHGRVTSARFTRDGAGIVYSAAWDGLPVAVHTTRLGGGGTRPLDLPSAELLAVSSRGEVAVSIGHRYIEGFHAAGKLAVAPLEGGEPRTLAEDIQEADFTPDGRDLAVIRRGQKGFRIELPLGHALFEAEWVSHARVSPDGSQVACLVHPSPFDDRGDVVVIDRKTERSRVVSAGYASAAGLAWAPSGEALWLSASRDGANNGVASLGLDGKEIFATETTGRLRVHDASAGGRVAVTHDTWRVPLRAKPRGALPEIDCSLSDVSQVGGMSADGRTLVFGEMGDIESSRGTYLRSTASGQAIRLGEGGPLALSPDGRKVLALVMDEGWKLYMYSTTSGERRSLSLGDVADVAWGALRDSERLVLGGSAAGRPPRLWRTSIRDKAPVPITPEGVMGRGHVSPDGADVAFITRGGRLRIVPIDAPERARDVPGSHAEEKVCGYRAGGREVFIRSASSPIEIRRVDLATGRVAAHLTIRPPSLGLKGVDAVVLDANGDAYAYSYGQELSRLYTMRIVRG